MGLALEVQDLTVRFGGLTAVRGVSFAVEHGNFAGLIGPNGAGKTTLVDAISGLVASTGSVRLDGAAIQKWPPHRRVQAGLGRTFQSLELFEDLTVRANLLTALQPVEWWAIVRDVLPRRRSETTAARIDEISDLLSLTAVLDVLPGQLSLGQRKMVTIGRALASSPRVLLLDEPAAGLDSSESQTLGKDLVRVVKSGTAILMIDHDMQLVLSVCDTISVLNFGQLIASGRPSEIRSNQTVIDAYLGSDE